jgi:hypothetical protein
MCAAASAHAGPPPGGATGRGAAPPAAGRPPSAALGAPAAWAAAPLSSAAAAAGAAAAPGAPPAAAAATAAAAAAAAPAAAVAVAPAASAAAATATRLPRTRRPAASRVQRPASPTPSSAAPVCHGGATAGPPAALKAAACSPLTWRRPAEGPSTAACCSFARAHAAAPGLTVCSAPALTRRCRPQMQAAAAPSATAIAHRHCANAAAAPKPRPPPPPLPPPPPAASRLREPAAGRSALLQELACCPAHSCCCGAKLVRIASHATARAATGPSGSTGRRLWGSAAHCAACARAGAAAAGARGAELEMTAGASAWLLTPCTAAWGAGGGAAAANEPSGTASIRVPGEQQGGWRWERQLSCAPTAALGVGEGAAVLSTGPKLAITQPSSQPRARRPAHPSRQGA